MSSIVGILNITPDSFSGDGTADNAAQAIKKAAELFAAGADIIDVGAESTRPGATPLQAAEEWQRLAPILPELVRLAQSQGKKISLDTRHAATAEAALAHSVHMINDVGGLQNSDMLRVLAQHTCPVVFMHALTIPADKNIIIAEDANVIEVLLQFATQVIARATQSGIARERLIFDPGIGFSKNAKQSIDILKNIDALRALQLPMYIGHSRKSFLNAYSPLPAAERDALTLAVSTYLLSKKVDYLRVHNVALHQSLRLLYRDLHA